MISFKTISTLLAAGTTLSLVSAGHARAITLNSSGPFCSNSDVSSAIACTGSYSGNDNDSNVLDTLAAEFGGTWSFDEANKSDTSGTNGIFTSNPGTATGTLTFDNPQTDYFVISLKAASNVSFYLFNGGNTPGGISSFDFNTIGTAVNNNDKAQALSHAGFFELESGTPIPTPALLPGLIGMGVAAFRKRNQESEGEREE